MEPPTDAIASADESAALPGRPSRSRRLRNIIFTVIGVGLLVGAVAVVVSDQRALDSAWRALRTAHWYAIAGVLLLPLVNWLFTAGTFHVLTRRYGRVGYGEMLALIASSWLLNMLPMRPGMIGRVAYHKKVNGISYRDSLKVIVSSVGATGVALAALLFAALMIGRDASTGRIVLGVLAPVLLLAIIGAGQHTLRIAHSPLGWRFVTAAGLRYGDMLIWCARYLLVFRVLGWPLTVSAGAAVTVAAQAAMLLPVQVGLREWVVGITAAALPEELRPVLEHSGHGAAEALASTAPGLLADGVNRVAELAIVIPIGLLSLAYLWRRTRKAGAKRAGVGVTDH